MTQLDAKGRCCGRKPIEYRGGAWNSPNRPMKYCPRCNREYDPVTGQQRENWAHTFRRPQDDEAFEAMDQDAP